MPRGQRCIFASATLKVRFANHRAREISKRCAEKLNIELSSIFTTRHHVRARTRTVQSVIFSDPDARAALARRPTGRSFERQIRAMNCEKDTGKFFTATGISAFYVDRKADLTFAYSATTLAMIGIAYSIQILISIGTFSAYRYRSSCIFFSGGGAREIL
jgi:hypothetical protein